VSSSPGGSRLSQTNSVTGDSGPDSDDLPSPIDRVREFIEEWPRMAMTPIAGNGSKVRAEVIDVDEPDPVGIYEEVFSGAPDPENEIMGMIEPDNDPIREMPGHPEPIVPDDAPRNRPVTVAEAMLAFLRDYEEDRGSRVYLEERDSRGNVLNSVEQPLENSFGPKYRKMRHAQLNGFEREIEAAYDRPVVGLFGLTGSAVRSDGSPRRPVDHMREIADAWTQSGGVRESLRNLMETSLGIGSDDWTYIKGGEPHPGDGPNRGFHHSHPIVLFDLAAVERERREELECQLGKDATPEFFQPVIDAHVEDCPSASHEAHQLDKITFREVGDGEDDIRDVASYAGGYIAGDVDTDLLEESLNYLVWATASWASTTQKFTAGRRAGAMIDADLCRSQAENGMHGPHGSVLRCTTAYGQETVECAHCGSHHDVPDTHAEARRARAESFREPDPPDSPTEPERSFADRWPSADAGASVGSSITAVREKDADPPDVDFSPVRWGGTIYCSACGETDPDDETECTADAYKDASYEVFCPVPPEHYGEHSVVEQYNEENGPQPDDLATGDPTDGGSKFDGYRGDGEEPLTGEFELIGRAKVASLIRDEIEEDDDRSDLEIAGAGLFGHPYDPKEWVNVVRDIRSDAEPVTDATESFDGEPPPEWEAVEVRRSDGSAEPIEAPGSVDYRVINADPVEPCDYRETADYPNQEVWARHRWSRINFPPSADESVDRSAPVDTRKAVIDALRDADVVSGVGPEYIASEVDGLDVAGAKEYLDRLATRGRVRSTGAGFVAVGAD
jgi:hypothetical protein